MQLICTLIGWFGARSGALRSTDRDKRPFTDWDKSLYLVAEPLRMP